MLGSYKWGWTACLMDATNHSTMCLWRMEPTDMLLKVELICNVDVDSLLKQPQFPC